MGRTFAAILLIAVLAVGAGAIATTAYQAGLSTAVTQAVADGATIINPAVAPAYAYGYGWGHGGPGFFGFLGTVLILLLVFGLIRGLIWGGRGRGQHGSGHGWGRGWGSDAPNGMRDRFHGTFEDWHREAHDPNAPTSSTGRSGDAPGSTTTDAR